MCLPLVNVKNEDKSVSAKFVVDLGDNFSKNFATTKKKKKKTGVGRDLLELSVNLLNSTAVS